MQRSATLSTTTPYTLQENHDEYQTKYWNNNQSSLFFWYLAAMLTNYEIEKKKLKRDGNHKNHPKKLKKLKKYTKIKTDYSTSLSSLVMLLLYSSHQPSPPSTKTSSTTRTTTWNIISTWSSVRNTKWKKSRRLGGSTYNRSRESL